MFKTLKIKKLVPLLLIIPFISLGQIGSTEKASVGKTIGKAEWYGNWYAELKKTNVDNKDYYVLSYKNAEYQTIFDIHSIGFYATEAELEYLFNELKKGFKSKEELKLNIGKTTIMFRKFMKSNIYISNLDGSGSWFSIPPNLFYELFGKKYDKKEFKSYLKS